MSRIRSPREAELAFLALLLRSADVRLGSHNPLEDEEIRHFYQAIGKYYRASEDELSEARASGCPLDEVAVVFHIARSAAVEAGLVARLRREGLRWTNILEDLHVSHNAFYVPVGSPTTVFPGRPYEDLWDEARRAWSDPGLSDADIVNLVNLKFISEYYRCRAEHVVALRSAGWSFAGIHADLGRPGSTREKKSR
ncbi:MAG: hypothetical protein KIT09_08265 [Bryobacteraceae bacterium]|nr:hypothetical protein [Bryobacteraceae bacterium]